MIRYRSGSLDVCWLGGCSWTIIFACAIRKCSNAVDGPMRRTGEWSASGVTVFRRTFCCNAVVVLIVSPPRRFRPRMAVGFRRWCRAHSTSTTHCTLSAPCVPYYNVTRWTCCGAAGAIQNRVRESCARALCAVVTRRALLLPLLRCKWLGVTFAFARAFVCVPLRESMIARQRNVERIGERAREDAARSDRSCAVPTVSSAGRL
jgi:hypothetical protein